MAIAGVTEINGKRYRVRADPDALARLAAAAEFGAGAEETRRFLRDVIDPRDQLRFARASARASAGDYTAAVQRCIAVICAWAEGHEDPDMREWAEGFRLAVTDHQQGDPQAFTRLGYACLLKWGAQ